MKKVLTTFLLILVCLTFSIDLQKALTIYKEFLEMYRRKDFSYPFLEFLNGELQNLSLYRYYKALLDKSVDRREATPDLGSYLARIYDAFSFESEDEQLAAALFMSYLTSRLTRANFSVEIVLKNDAFIKFFTTYRDVVTREARTFFAWVISYQLGLCEEKPPVDVEVVEVLQEVSYRFTPPTQLVHIKDLVLFYSDPSVQEVLTQAVSRARQNILSDPTRAMAHINREANFVARDIYKPITTFQVQVAKEALKVTPTERNFSWIRFIVYIPLLYLFRKKLGFFKILVTALLALEILLFLVYFDPFSTYQGLAYGLIAIFSFGFCVVLTIRKFVEKRNLLDLLFVVATIAVVFMPFVYSCKQLTMDKYPEIKDSVYYPVLKRELFEDELSKVFQLTRSLATTLYMSVDETKKVFNELLNTFVDASKSGAFNELNFSPYPFISFNDSSGFYSAQNFKERLTLFKNANTILENFLLDESSRKRNFEKNLRKLKSHLHGMFVYSADFLRLDLIGHIEKLFTHNYPVLSDVLPLVGISSWLSEPVKSPNVPIFKEITGIKVFVALLLVFSILTLLGPFYALPSAFVAAVFAVVQWIGLGQLKIFVEQELPVIEVHHVQSVNPAIFVLIIGLLMINILKLFGKGERV
ncbi:hypothetical protein [Pseudothermotoga thermarum]|uniref:Uncharacterized protein n=1 Tax=Pseudothermotoga thermarum DSM 5069 TaxID=688269 RepID=F7YTR5_9THEM|nr:hypothetical protein [Pseudothermotoga thermarum]AEH51294.1 hypothetical protein Theth_1222 [Pseudothermotoga thermarum DSM 5069]